MVKKSKKINSFWYKKYDKWWHYLLAAFFITALIISGSLLTFEKIYAQRIYPGITVGNHHLAGSIKPQAERLLLNAAYKILKQKIIFETPEKSITITPTKLTKPGSEKNLIIFHTQELVGQMFTIGRNKDYFSNLKEQARAAAGNFYFLPDFFLNEKWLKQILAEQFADIIKPAQNAQLEIIDGKIIGIKPEKKGRNLNYAEAFNNIRRQLKKFEPFDSIKLSFVIDYPKITGNDAEKFREAAEKLLDFAPLSLTYENKNWEINKKTLGEWLELQYKDKNIKLGLNKNKVLAYLTSLGAEINRRPQDAELEIKNGRAVKFKPQLNGLELDTEKSFSNLIKKLLGQNKTDIQLTVKTISPQITLADINNLGIKELVGVGRTNFRGSPPNRVKNISRGAALLQGLLIKPNEEFSLLNALKPFTHANGYFDELVIKGDETVPEVGGGLCQIGTTMFRVVLNSGLPVTQRRNHSYRVSYYEPPVGMDATIYDPAPDFKFLNDTGNYLLLTTRIEGTDLIFELWGSKDGRIATTTKPISYNFIQPPPKKTIETTDLPLGKIKCTERAHVGSEAKFTYKITYADGRIEKKEFHSKYQPWREVCLLGVEKLSEEKNQKTDNKP